MCLCGHICKLLESHSFEILTVVRVLRVSAVTFSNRCKRHACNSDCGEGSLISVVVFVCEFGAEFAHRLFGLTF